MRSTISIRLLRLIYFLIFSVFAECATPNPKDFIVWGRGLVRDAVLPVRYIFIQPVDENGQNITESLKGSFTANFGDNLRINPQFVDAQDGLYIFMFRMFRPYKDLSFEILYDGQLVGNSPYTLSDWTYDEDCYCPADMEQWLDAMECKQEHKEMDEQLSLYRAINTTAAYNEILKNFRNPGAFSIVNYVIKDNKIYRRTFGQHVQFKTFMDSTLLSLTRKIRFPDMEFFLNLGDFSLVTRRLGEPFAMFSWGAERGSLELVLPSYEIMTNTQNQLYSSYLDTVSMHGKGVKWSEKITKAFFRGRDSSQARLNLYFLSKENPDLIDANITRMFFFKWDNITTGETVPFYDFYKYKYIINMDGTVAPFRTPYLLGSLSLMLKEESENYEFFYRWMKPNVHYIQFKTDLSDLVQKINWAIDHDKEAEEFGKRARKFALEHILPEHLYCYHVVYFKKYHEQLVTRVKIHEDMEHVEQPAKFPCECKRPIKREDL